MDNVLYLGLLMAVVAVDKKTTIDTDVVIHFQSSLDVRNRHSKLCRANADAPNCGRKPKYKDHDKKRGLAAKKSLAAWNV